MKAIILAAGQARRLYPLTKDIPKSLLPIGGRTILARQVAALRAVGIDEIVVVVGHHEEKVREALGTSVRYVYNRYFAATADIVSLWCARRHMRGPFVYLHGDVLMTRTILERLVREPAGDVQLAVDVGPADAEAEKIRIRGGRVTAIGKALAADADGEFIGVARVSGAAAPQFRLELEALVDAGHIEQQCVETIQRLIDAGTEVTVSAVGDEPWTEVDFAEDVEDAVHRAALFA